MDLPDRVPDGSRDEDWIWGGPLTRIGTYLVVVFDEGWDWPPGTYQVRVDGLTGFFSQRPVTVSCEGQIQEPGHAAGTYSIDFTSSKTGDRFVRCTNDATGDWIMTPPIAGGLRVMDVMTTPNKAIRVRVIDAHGIVVHDVEAKPLVDVVFLGPVPPLVGPYAQERAHRAEVGNPPPWKGPVDEFGLPIEEEQADSDP